MDAASAAASSTKGVMENVEQPHVLAVDDNLIDRKLIEQLLINSSCKGDIYSFFLCWDAIVSWFFKGFFFPQGSQLLRVMPSFYTPIKFNIAVALYLEKITQFLEQMKEL